MTTHTRSRLTACLLLLILIAAWLYYLFTPMVDNPKGAVFYLPSGETKHGVAKQLSQEGTLHSPWLATLYFYLHFNTHIKVGEYFFPKGSSVASMWYQMASGTGLYYRPFLIVPGWNFKQLRASLDSTTTLHHTTALWTNNEIMAKLGAALSPEGQFFPETYYYTRGNADLIILKHAYDLMQTKLLAAWQTRATDLPFQTPYEALIAASLIEKEAYLNSERPIIAGVLINRLSKGMLLQIDPTVIYGIGTRYNGKLYKADLLDTNPYNTYIHKGLPPTPIAMPGMTSIMAALHPNKNDYYYYVSRGDGSHQFSKTWTEQKAAILQYKTAFDHHHE